MLQPGYNYFLLMPRLFVAARVKRESPKAGAMQKEIADVAVCHLLTTSSGWAKYRGWALWANGQSLS